ncbi:IS701 family transposase [Streptomyces sp. F001]|uniref:IS701 family transposase n=1 Tax=Streptomyces sp. F001 TaxID=1510026 RepID=UPI00101E8230|nr:IS701 family transposase [Streptomyces sp. F001]RZB14574.1 IS701 family transposase [Streptomyces sp. F001]
MDAHEVNRVRATLALYVADVFASVPRKDQRAKGDCYLRGLMLDGRRKSIQAMASRLPDGNEQNLQQFVNQSTWDPVPVQRRICERMLPLIDPTAWVIDDVSVPKDGRMSVGVAPQYCGALGKRANCQVAVSVHAASDTASCPLQWRLFLPTEWASDTGRRTVTRVPPEVTHREKWRLALDMLDTLAGWGMRPPVVVADAAYGTNAHLRTELADRQLADILAVRADVTAHPFDAKPVAPDRNGPVGCRPTPRSPTWSVWPRVRRRIEHDYRELKHGLGLDHFEGRSWPGWHHHVTLVTAAHAFLTEQRLAPKAPAPVSPSTKSSTPSRTS